MAIYAVKFMRPDRDDPDIMYLKADSRKSAEEWLLRWFYVPGIRIIPPRRAVKA